MQSTTEERMDHVSNRHNADIRAWARRGVPAGCGAERGGVTPEILLFRRGAPAALPRS